MDSSNTKLTQSLRESARLEARKYIAKKNLISKNEIHTLRDIQTKRTDGLKKEVDHYVIKLIYIPYSTDQ